MSALKVDDALQAIATLQQEKAELLAALKALEETAMRYGLAHDPAVHEDVFFGALTAHFAALTQARDLIVKAEGAK